MAWWWCVVLAVVVLRGCRAATLPSPREEVDNSAASPVSTPSGEHDDYLLKQLVWKRCYRKISPACLKLNLIRTVELMTKDSSLSLVPGVFFTSNASEFNALPPDIARSLSSEHAPLDDLVAFTVGKYLRSLTLNVNIVDFVSGGNETLQRSVIDAFSGRARKNGLMGGYGAIAAMMGGTMASMMMAALAALAGKAMMTSLLALIMAAFAAMKGGGGGGGTKTYEVITKPVVSHIDTHSSEVQHEHHGHYHKRSLELGGDDASEQEQMKTAQVKGVGSEEDHQRKSKTNENMKEEIPTLAHPYLWKRSVDHQQVNHQSRNIDRKETMNEDSKDKKSIFQRGLIDRFSTTKLFASPENPKEVMKPLIGHPRQNHKEYKRHTDDDLLMAFGLFR